MMDQNIVTAGQAREVMSVFLNAPNVLGVEVVGSVARDYRGHDLDLVIIVDPFRYASFVRAMCDWVGYREPT